MQAQAAIEQNIPLPEINPVAESNKRRSNPAREAARLAGEAFYFTGEPCKYGHIANRYVKNAQCVECLKIRTSNKRKESPEQFKEYNRKSWLKKAYGISVEEYEALFEKQGGKCAICEKDLNKASHVDHCHDSGKIRGILCPACNKGIGHFYDSPELLIKAAGYCKRHE